MQERQEGLELVQGEEGLVQVQGAVLGEQPREQVQEQAAEGRRPMLGLQGLGQVAVLAQQTKPEQVQEQMAAAVRPKLELRVQEQAAAQVRPKLERVQEQAAVEVRPKLELRVQEQAPVAPQQTRTKGLAQAQVQEACGPSRAPVELDATPYLSFSLGRRADAEALRAGGQVEWTRRAWIPLAQLSRPMMGCEASGPFWLPGLADCCN